MQAHGQLLTLEGTRILSVLRQLALIVVGDVAAKTPHLAALSNYSTNLLYTYVNTGKFICIYIKTNVADTVMYLQSAVYDLITAYNDHPLPLRLPTLPASTPLPYH